MLLSKVVIVFVNVQVCVCARGFIKVGARVRVCVSESA